MPSHNKNTQKRRFDFGASKFSFLGRGLIRKNTSNTTVLSSVDHRLQGRSNTSIYNRMFGSATRSKIVKPKYRNMNQVQSSLEQKEQYQKLIEQFRCSGQQNQNLFVIKEKRQEPIEIIDLELNETIVSGNLAPKYDKISELAAKTLERTRQRIELLQRDSKKITNGIENGDYEVKNVQDDLLKAQGDVQVTRLSIPDFFPLLPASRFLAEDFISNLSQTYGPKQRERQSQIAALEAKAKQQREKREMKEQMLSEILKEKLHMRQRLEEESDEEDEELPELTDDMEEEIDEALAPGMNDVLAEEFNICINRQCIHTLDGLNWLNDEVINFYMELIVKRSKESEDFVNVHAMNTFFYPKLKSQSYSSVRRWTRKVDVFAKDLILFPIHLGVHWCLAVADFKVKEFRYYDSMGGCNNECLRVIRDWLTAEHKDKKKTPYDVSDWKSIVYKKSEIPQQMNGSDCGVFTCKFAEYLAAEETINFSQEDMPYFRRAMVWEILNKSLLR